MPTFKKLTQKIGYSFKNLKLLELACTHKSYGYEHQPDAPISERDNERLEFLGDAILDFIVSKILFEHCPHLSEGDLSKLRASLVNEKSLSEIAKNLDLGSTLSLGKGEENTGGREKDSILGSTFEALIAAIFLDAGYETTKSWVQDQFLSRIKTISPQKLEDYKTRLQEIIQAKFKTVPKYDVIQTTGPDHDRRYEVQLSVKGAILSQAAGKSKKEAEQAAAHALFEKYGENLEQLT